VSVIGDKIRKLLALARDKGASEHEALQALEMATRLMMQHGIEERDLNNTTIGAGSILESTKRYHMICANVAAELCGVIPVFNYDRLSFRFTGRSENIEGAAAMYEFVVQQVELLYKISLPRGLSQSERAEFRRTFKEACAMRVYARAQAIINAVSSERGNALVVIDHRKQLRSEAEEMIKKAGGTHEKSQAISIKPTVGAVLGVQAGNSVKLHRGVSNA